MRTEDALSQLRVIQEQVVRTEQYCCYRWATVAGSGLIALGAAVMQSSWITDTVPQLPEYLLLWLSVAAVSVGIIGTEMLLRWQRTESAYERRQTISALQQFVPCIVAGALVTLVIWVCCPQHAVLYPGIWASFFSLGIFASLKHLPAGTFVVAVYYLTTGMACIGWGQAEQALAPWTMAITFGMGQLISAYVLYRQEGANGNA